MEWALGISIAVNLVAIWLCQNSFRKWDRDQGLISRLETMVRRRDIVINEMSAMVKSLREDEAHDRSIQQLEDDAARQCCGIEVPRQAN